MREIDNKLGLSLLSFLFVICSRVARISGEPPDFISIDCGSDAGGNRTDNNTITWTNDDSFIFNGYNSGKLETAQGQWLPEYYDFRYFNESQSKFCYELPMKINKQYLIRAGFLWANFSDLANGPVVFDLTVMSTLWATLNISSAENVGVELKDGVTTPLTKEIIIWTTSNVTSVCLVKKQNFPFINSLEMRLLDNDMYSDRGSNKALVSQWRWTAGECGGTGGFCSSSSPRYPVDPYDRIWYQYDDRLHFGNVEVAKNVAIDGLNISTSFLRNSTEIAPVSSSINRPPVETMKDAWFVNGPLNMHFPLDGSSSNNEYYIALYFQELRNIPDGSRNFSLSINDQFVDNYATPAAGFEFRKVRNITGSWVNITLDKISTDNPILNAAEMYGLLDVNSSSTAEADAAVLSVIRNSLGLKHWSGDPCLPVPWDGLSCSDSQPSRVTQIKLVDFGLDGSIPTELNDLRELTDLWLDQNRFTGPIPNFNNLSKLKTIHLRKNNLSGHIPSTLSKLPELRELFLDNNNLSGTVPESLLERAESNGSNFNFSFAGNPSLSLPNSDSDSKFSTQLILAIVGGAVLLAVSAVLAVVVLFRFHNRPKARSLGDQSFKGRSFEAGHYSYPEIQKITNDFEAVLGSGPLGEVYYGKLPDGQEVAVKVNAASFSQEESEFATEAILLSRVHHEFLVPLVGYCFERDKQILVNIYMSNGSLGDYLHGSQSVTPLSWKKRLDIAFSAAQGLEFLNTSGSPPIIHGSVKPNNILLDENMVGRLTDFGVSRSEPQGFQISVSPPVKGTGGYLDPEYFTGLQKLSVKSDVYSFGVVLLELISGQKPTAVHILADGTEIHLIRRAELVSTTEDLAKFIDSTIGSLYNLDAAWKVLQTGLACVQAQRADRPDMIQVVQGLAEAVELEKATAIKAQSRGSVGDRKLKCVAFQDKVITTDYTVVPLRNHSMESLAPVEPEQPYGYIAR